MRRALAAALVLLLVACDSAPQEETYSARRARVLSGLAEGAAGPALAALEAQAQAYAGACAAGRSPEDLAKARQAWRALRVEWRRAAPWLIASAAEGLYEERLDAMPDYARLAKHLAGSEELDAAGVAALGWPQKSLAAQGDLLFAEELSPRAWSLLQHGSREWAAEVGTLTKLWSAPGGLQEALASPKPTGPFRDAKDATDVLLRRLVTVVARLRDDDVAALAGGTRKGKPASFPPEFDRAGHHREEILATLNGVAALYLGTQQEGKEGGYEGLSALVAKKSPRVDASFRAALENAQREAQGLSEDAVRAAREDPKQAQALYDFVTLMRAQLTTSIASQLDTSLGFTLADGD